MVLQVRISKPDGSAPDSDDIKKPDGTSRNVYVYIDTVCKTYYSDYYSHYYQVSGVCATIEWEIAYHKLHILEYLKCLCCNIVINHLHHL